MNKLLLYTLGLFILSSNLLAEQDNKDKGVKYKKSKKIDFASLLIQGDKRKADILVVTGDANDDLDGLLRLRENFHDQQALDFGEEVK